MGFQLKVSKGKNLGQEFTFAEADATIGRTEGNDLVLRDRGVSRNHARIFQEGGRWFVEDMGSSNGTWVNGDRLTGPREIKTGDAIGVGDVIFAFTAIEPTRSDKIVSSEWRVLQEHDDVHGHEETVFSDSEDDEPAEVVTSPGDDTLPRRDTDTDVGSKTLPPKNRGDETRIVAEEGLQPASEVSTRKLPRLERRALARREGSAMGASLRSSLARPEKETAAERARRRREAQKTLVGRLTWAISELPLAGKIAVGVAALALVGGGIFGLSWAMASGKVTVAKGPEPERLSFERITDSFGLGEGVDWQNADLKLFSFEIAAATRAVAVLHYQAKDIGPEEVAVSVDGVDIGFVPGDTLDADSRELEMVLPPAYLQKGTGHRLMFDNVKNPGVRTETWRIWNLWLEVIPIPDLPDDELIRLAHEDAGRALKAYERRDIAAENLFEAWKHYRNAWLTLEALSEKPELYGVVRAQLKAIQLELDKKCGLLLLDAQRAIELKKRKRARQVLEEIYSRYFPTREHRCHLLARAKMDEYGL